MMLCTATLGGSVLHGWVPLESSPRRIFLVSDRRRLQSFGPLTRDTFIWVFEATNEETGNEATERGS